MRNLNNLFIMILLCSIFSNCNKKVYYDGSFLSTSEAGGIFYFFMKIKNKNNNITYIAYKSPQKHIFNVNIDYEHTILDESLFKLKYEDIPANKGNTQYIQVDDHNPSNIKVINKHQYINMMQISSVSELVISKVK